MGRTIHVEVRNPAGEKLCDLYDSSIQFAGQITDISVSRDLNELGSLSFTMPKMIEDPEHGRIVNPRWDYIKNEYLIWYTDENGTEVFRIKQPEQSSSGVKQSTSVECLHRAESLKRRNVAKSLDEQVDDAASHLYRVLEGSGWTVGRVDPFYEDGLYNKKIIVGEAPVESPSDMSFGAYAEIDSMTGDTVWDEEVGFANASPCIISVGKNLCDGMIERGSLTPAQGLPEYIATSARYRTINYMNVSHFVGHTMVVSGTNVGGAIWHLYDKSKKQTQTVNGLTLAQVPEQTVYAKVEFLYNEAGSMDFPSAPYQVQIELGIQTAYERYKTPYRIDVGPLGKFDTVSGNRIYRKTGYNEETHTPYELETVRLERLEVYGAKLYEGGHVYIETVGAGTIGSTELRYTVEADKGGTPRIMLRAYSKESGTSCFEAIAALRAAFNCNAVYHGAEKTVDLVKHAGIDRDVVFYPGKNLNSMKIKRESTDIITRLYVTGQESESGYIGIEDVSPMGANFLLNFQYFDNIGVLTEEHKQAIKVYEQKITELGKEQKPVIDDLYSQQSEINRMVGQTPMGVASVTSVAGTTVGVGEIVGWLDGEMPESGNVVYLRDGSGEWKAYEVASFNAAQREITLTSSPESASAAWWFKRQPAGSVGARLVIIKTQNDMKASLEKQIGLSTDSELVKALRDKVDKIDAELLILSKGDENTEGLSAMLAALTERIGQATEAETQIEQIREEREAADVAFESLMGEMILDGVFPNGSYASGQELALYTDANRYLQENALPQVEYTVDAKDLSYLDGFEIERIRFGDGVYITEPRLGIDRLPVTVTKYTDRPLAGKLNSFDVGNFGEKVDSMVEEMLSSAETIKRKEHVYDRAEAIEPGGTISAEVVTDSINKPGVIENIDLSQNNTITGNPGFQQYITGQITQVTDAIQETVAINREDIYLVNKKVTDVEFKITDEAIIATVTESNQYKADISGATDLAQEAIDKANQTEDGLIDVSERLNVAEQKITSEAIVNTVMQSEEFTGAISALTGEIDGLTERVQAAEQKIEPDQIIATVTQSETYKYDLAQIQSSVDKIQVGGTNMLLGTLTQDAALGNYQENVEDTEMKLYGCPVFSVLAIGGNIGFNFKTQVVDRGLIVAGGELTYSLYIKTDDDVPHIMEAVGTKASGGEWFRYTVGQVAIQEGWQRLSCTFTVSESMLTDPDYLNDFYVVSSTPITDGKFLYYACPKLEKGNRATDWTPAPQDVSDYTDSEVNGLGDQVSGMNEELNDRMELINNALNQLNQSDQKFDASMVEIQKNMETLQKQTDEGFSWTAKVETIVSAVNEQGERLNQLVDDVERNMTFTADEGLVIGKKGSKSSVAIDEDSLDVRVDGVVSATFGSEGMKTNSIELGKMRIYARGDGVVVFDRI